MKKTLSFLLALVLVFSLVACGKKETPTEGETKETVSEGNGTETSNEEVAEGEIAKVGLGIVVGLQAGERGENINAQQNATYAAVAFDKDGKIVSAQIDTAQSTMPITKEGKFVTPVEDVSFKTKHELGDDYGMKGASGIQKEWTEQIRAFEEYIVGKTADEVAGIPTEKKDDAHLNVPTDVDLLASVTIDIGAYQKAVVKAWENAKDAAGTTKVGQKAITVLGRGTKEAEGEDGASVQFETTVSTVALNADDEIVVSFLDTAQNTIKLNKDGSVAGELGEGTTKMQLGSEYAMKEASPIGKEWDEQMKAMEEWTMGKKLADIEGMKLEEGKPADADLKSTTTIIVTNYQKALEDAIKLAK